LCNPGSWVLRRCAAVLVGAMHLHAAALPALQGLRAAAPSALVDAYVAPVTGTAIAAAAGRLSSAPVTATALYFACDLCLPINVGLAPMFGTLFSFPTALAIVLTGSVAAATAAFFIGRLLQLRVIDMLDSAPVLKRQFNFVDRAITRGGFRAMLLLRLIPTPIPALNFMYGLTRVRGKSYILATALGNLPGSAAVVSTAALGKQLFHLRRAVAGQQWWSYVIAAAALAGLARLAARLVEKAKFALDELAGEECVPIKTDLETDIETDRSDVGADAECVIDECRPWLLPSDAAAQCS